MNTFRLSPIALVIASLSLSATAEGNNNQNEETITVYGKQNQLILESGTATKSNMELIQIPAAIVVVSKELINQQGVTDLQEAIRNVSGLNQAGNNYGIGDNLVIRGLGANYTYDGMYAGAGLDNSFNPTRSMTNIESIEVIKGPATGLYGIGSAGGVINLVEKQAKQKAAYNIKANIGQWNSQQIMFDATGPLSDVLAYRFVANHESSDGYRGLSKERTEIFSTFLFNVAENHNLTLSGSYRDDSVQIDSVGHPVRIVNQDSINGSATDWQALVNNPDSNFGVQLTDPQRQQLANSITESDGLKPYDLGSGSLISPLSKPNKGEELRIKLKSQWNFSEMGKLTQQLQYRDYDSEFTRQTGAYNYVYWNRGGIINAAPRAPLVIDDVLYPYAARRQEYRKQISNETSWQYFADLQLDWQWNNMSGEHLISANYENRDISLKYWSIYDADGTSSDNAVPYILDIRNPNWPTGKFEDYNPSLRSNYNKTITASGISLQEVVYFTDSLTGRFGGAFSKIKQAYQHLGTDRSPLQTEEADTDDKGFTYNLGLNYRVTPELAGFVNLSKGQTAYSILGVVSPTQPDGSTAPNQPDNRPDSTSESFDIGVRFTALNEELIGSIVWFETKRTNLRYNNELFNDNPDADDFNIDVPQYFYDDEDKTKGVELDINFDINNSFSMNVNATYQDAKLIRNINRGSAFPVASPVKGIPQKFASLWGQYHHTFSQLPGEFNINLGVTYEDERTINAANFGLPISKVDSYTVWDMAMSYELDNLKLQLNVNNLFDKTYYSKAMFLGGLPGESRNANLTLDYKF